MAPSLPAQLSSITMEVMVMTSPLSVTVAVATLLLPTLSVTVMVKVPALRPDITGVVAPLLHAKV